MNQCSSNQQCHHHHHHQHHQLLSHSLGLDENLNSYSGREISSPVTVTTLCSSPSPSPAPPSPDMDIIKVGLVRQNLSMFEYTRSNSVT